MAFTAGAGGEKADVLMFSFKWKWFVFPDTHQYGNNKKKIQSTSFFLQSAHSPQRTEFFHRYRRMCFNSIPLPGAVLGADCSSCRASRECSIHKEGLNRLELQEAVKDWCNAKPEFENIWGNATVLQGDFKSYRLKALVNQGTVCGQ